MFTKSRDYPLRPEDVPRLVNGVRRFLSIKGYKTQDIPDKYVTAVIQASKVSVLRDFTGFSSAIVIRIWPRNDVVRVQTVSERWLMRAAVTFVGLMLPPPFVAPMIGGDVQFRHVDELWLDISEQVTKLLHDG